MTVSAPVGLLAVSVASSGCAAIGAGAGDAVVDEELEVSGFDDTASGRGFLRSRTDTECASFTPPAALEVPGQTP